jgi:hypothetical protein
MVTRITISVMLLTLAGTSAFADERDHRWRHCEGRACVAAPEIDPTQAVSALMLLGGSVAVLRGRRKKK